MMGEAVYSTTGRWRLGQPQRGWVGLRAASGQALLALLLVVGLAAAVRAESTSERSGSILIFPKVVYNSSRDTFIQVSNTSNSMVHAHCFYVNAAPICIGSGDCLSNTCSGRCEPQWQEVDFDIWLTKQQPTHWLAGFGRFPDPTDDSCARSQNNYDCDGAGLDPGRIPPVTFPFVGELRCIEVDQSGAPISGNHLKGEATILTSDGDASKYNAVALLGEPFTNNGDNVLCLGGGVSDECPSGAEYAGCGERAIVNHFAENADSPLFGPTSKVNTEVTIVPCRADYERQEPTRIVVNFLAFNEFENRFSAGTTVECWRSFFLEDASSIFRITTTQTRLVETQMRSSSLANSGFVGIVEEYHRIPGLRFPDEVARAAFNLHEQGTRPKTDLIFLPEGP
jgi:hypothetical protein